MRRLVVSISYERYDGIRISYVSKWIKNQADNKYYEEGVKLIHPWDEIFIHLDGEFQ